MTDPGGNNSLVALRVAPGELIPAFSPNTLIYTVKVASTVTSVTVSATTADSQATMSGDVSASAGLGSGQRTIQLQSPGVTTPVTIWVTAPGGVQKTYTINVLRAGLGGNNLLNLAVSPGYLNPSFSAASTSYTVSVDEDVRTVNVTPTLQDTNAIATVNGRNTMSGHTRPIDLSAPGSRTKINVTVYPSSGSEKTYLITVNRAAHSLGVEMQQASEHLQQSPAREMASTVRPDIPEDSLTPHGDRGITNSSETICNIMISYRRDDSADVTGRIHDRLVQKFGREAAFMDVDSIPFGVDFRTYLDGQVAKCDVFLAVIGPDWMEPRDRTGTSRLNDPEDFVRIEIESALKREIPVIPVLVRGAKIPAADRLPASIQGLSYRNGITIRSNPDFHRDMDRLIEGIKARQQARVHENPIPKVDRREAVESGLTDEIPGGFPRASPQEPPRRAPQDDLTKSSREGGGKGNGDQVQLMILGSIMGIILIGALVAFLNWAKKPDPAEVIVERPIVDQPQPSTKPSETPSPPTTLPPLQ